MKNVILLIAILTLAACAPAVDTTADPAVNDVEIETPQVDEISDDILADNEADKKIADEEMGDKQIVDDGMSDNPGVNAAEQSVADVTFVLTGKNFAFFKDGVEAPELRAKVGDLVRVEFTSTGGFHDWVVDEFAAATQKVQTDGETYVEFTVDKAGTFEYYCSVGSHRANGMVGNLVVV